MRRALITCLVALATGTLASSCDDEPAAPPRYPFTFNTHADGDGLEGVRINVNNAPVGVTNGEGVLRVDLTGPEGAPVRVSAVCPEGHRSTEDAQVHNLRRVQSLDPATAARGIEVTFACPPEHRNAVVVVRTHNQVGLPIMLDGREAARTDGSGVAHLAVVMTPGTAFQVLVDTRHNERLRPRSPTQTYTVPDRDEVFVLDQRFVEEAPPRRVRRRARAAAPASRLPQRISSH